MPHYLIHQKNQQHDSLRLGIFDIKLYGFVSDVDERGESSYTAQTNNNGERKYNGSHKGAIDYSKRQ